MRVTLYDATDGQCKGRPLEGVSSVEVEVHPQRWVADVLKGGHVWCRSFALVTPEIEGRSRLRRASHDQRARIFRDRRPGAIKFQGPDHVTWAEFLRAQQAGLYEGDPTRIVVYPYGGLGGLSPDGVWEAVQRLFKNREVAVDALGDVAKAGGGGDKGGRMGQH